MSKKSIFKFTIRDVEKTKDKDIINNIKYKNIRYYIRVKKLGFLIG